jgi:NADPH2 dehydrogenase
MKFGDFVKVKSLSNAQGFKENLERLGLPMPCDEQLESGDTATMAQPLTVSGLKVGNRYAIHPMEGWDGLADGSPSDNTRRRWSLFGRSGAKMIWGGEAVAVRHDGRANPKQLVMNAQTQSGIAQLREGLVQAHRESMGNDNDLVIGLQLTHSGRFCKPNLETRMEPRVLYHHPLLDGRFGPKENTVVMSDGEIRELIDDFVVAAKRAWNCGFQFVDLKHCHGYLGHEFLSAKTREGDFGGSLHNRTRFIRELAQGIRAEVPGMALGVRLSAVDFLPYKADPSMSDEESLGPGIPVDYANALPYRYGFGVNESNPLLYALDETAQFLKVLESLDISMVNVTVGSPYYTPHVTRPALYPPSDGYQPPEDPLVGVMRHLEIVRDLKENVSCNGFCRQRLHLSARVPAVCGTSCRQTRLDRLCRTGPHGVGLPRATSRRTGRSRHATQTPVSHLQRLHHSTTQWFGFGLLPAGCALQKVSANGRTHPDQKSCQVVLIASAAMPHQLTKTITRTPEENYPLN